jgi:hypothetical protein
MSDNQLLHHYPLSTAAQQRLDIIDMGRLTRRRRLFELKQQTNPTFEQQEVIDKIDADIAAIHYRQVRKHNAFNLLGCLGCST